MLPTGKEGIGSVSWHAWQRCLWIVTALAAGCGTAAAQDFSAGKTAPQLFASDCSACHKSPAGLAKGRDARSLTSFLREHYTTKEESAAALAAFLAGAGPGSGGAAAEAKPKPQTPAATTGPTGPKPKTAARGDNEPEARPDSRPEPRPKPEARPDSEGDTTIMREERRPSREATRTEPDPMVGRLKLYGASGSGGREIERSADKSKKVDSCVNSGSPAETVAPADTGSTNAVAAPGADDAHAAKHKKKDAVAGAAPPASDTAAHAPRPRRAQAPAVQPPPGNN